VVLGREVGRQQAHGSQAEGTLTEHWQDDREPPRGPCRLDAVVGGRLGEVKDGAAICEEGREARGPVEAPGVELGQVSEQARRGFTLAPGERLHRRHEIVVGELGWVAGVGLHGQSIAYQRE
jgi:hypothetical protein